VLYAAPSPALPSIEWLKGCFALPVVEPGLRRSLLAGRPVGGADDGPVVCACFQVGRRRVEAAIAGGACTAAEVGLATRAGTNCGSCLPEIKTLLGGVRRALPTAAE
jgi:assimilatory nitrate reductase catalytic subunit